VLGERDVRDADGDQDERGVPRGAGAPTAYVHHGGRLVYADAVRGRHRPGVAGRSPQLDITQISVHWIRAKERARLEASHTGFMLPQSQVG